MDRSDDGLAGDRSPASGEASVLIVEDEACLRDAYRALLDPVCDVVTAADGEAALAEVDESVDAVFLDRRMPGMTGDEVLATLRERGYDTPVAMVTAVDPAEDVLDLSLGRYLKKPVGREELTGTVETLTALGAADEASREWFRLVEKRTALETAPSVSHETSDEYETLCNRIEDLSQEVEAAPGERFPNPDEAFRSR